MSFPGSHTGLVLVFDLDQTLIDSNGIDPLMRDNMRTLKAALNPTILEIIDRAEELSRERPGSIDAFLLLTNNNAAKYISDVCTLIAKRYAVRSSNNSSNFRRVLNSENARIDGANPLFFDYIMMRGNKHRGNMVKSLTDVRTMLDALGIGTSDLPRRTFFFDDGEHPSMRYDLESHPYHYIQIKSDVPYAGFSKGHPDTTDYSTIKRALAESPANDNMSGGKRKTRRNKKRSTRRRG